MNNKDNHITVAGNDKPTPADIFHQAVQILYAQLEPLGWKLLKNGDMKKKYKNFTCKIFFFRHYNNFIDHKKNIGCVKLEIYCDINVTKREAAYRLQFNHQPFYLLSKDSSVFSNECIIISNDIKLNTNLIEEIWEVIKLAYIDVVNGLADNPRQQVLEMGLISDRHSPDYSYSLYLRKELLEALELSDLINLYNENNECYNTPENSARVSKEWYFYTIKDRVDVHFCNELKTEELLSLVDEAYNFLKQTKRYDEYVEAQYQHFKNMSQSDKFKWVIAGFWFIYPNITPWFEKHPSAKLIMRKILEFHKKLIPSQIRNTDG